MPYTSSSAQHVGSRREQQDALTHFTFTNSTLLAVLADGMGGMAHGEKASRAAIEAFLSAYRQKNEAESIPEALDRAIRSANDAVFQLALALGSAEDMGTTLVAVVLEGQHLYWTSAGDSGIFLFRQGEITQCNTGHTFGIELDDQVQLGNIRRQDAEAHPEREALTSFLGLERITYIDHNPRPFHLKEDDIVLLASDGLFKTLSFLQIARLLEGPSSTIADSLVKQTIAARRPFQDNVSVIVLAPQKEVESAPLIEPDQPEDSQPPPAVRRPLLGVILILLALAALLVYAGMQR